MKRGSLTYKQKYVLLLIIAGLFSLVIFKLSIQKTIRLYHSNQEALRKLENVSKAPQSIAKLQSEIEHLDALFGQMENETDHRAAIIQKCSDFCKENRIRVAQIKEPDILRRDKLIVETTELHFEGSHKNLLRLVYFLETTAGNGKLSSICFQKEMNKRSKEERLILKIFIQSITKQNN